MFLDGGDPQIHQCRSGAKSLDAPSYSKDRGSKEQPPVNLTTFGYGPFSTKSRLIFTSSIEVRNGGDWQRPQSEEDESWVEVTVERGYEELNDSTGNREGGKMKAKSMAGFDIFAAIVDNRLRSTISQLVKNVQPRILDMSEHNCSEI